LVIKYFFSAILNTIGNIFYISILVLDSRIYLHSRYICSLFFVYFFECIFSKEFLPVYFVAVKADERGG